MSDERGTDLEPLVPRLLTIEKAAIELGVPPGSLRTAAQQHGFLVRIGRALRIDPNDIPELIDRCRDTPRDPDCIVAATAAAITSSATPEAGSPQRALAITEKLKELSRGTSPRKIDGRVRRTK